MEGIAPLALPLQPPSGTGSAEATARDVEDLKQLTSRLHAEQAKLEQVNGI